MHKSFCSVALIAAVLLAFAACSNNNKIGSTIKGKRIAILDQSHKLEADKDLAGAKPALPSITIVKSWPEVGYNNLNLMPNAALDAHPKIIWSANIGEGSDSDYRLLAKPIVADGTLFTMDAQGLVSAFNAATGDKKWDFDTTPENRDENATGGGLGFDQGALYVTSGFGEVLALNASDGKVKWRKQLLNPIRSAPVIANGHVYVVCIDNELQALDAHNGEILWHHRGIAESATLMGASSPAVTPDGVVVAYSSGEIYNLRPENGRSAWSYTLTVPTQVGAMPAISDIRGLPVIDQDRVYAISQSGRVAAIDLRTGDRAWEADIGGINTPMVAGDTVFVLSNDMQLVALARASGRVMWVEDLQKYIDPKDKDSGSLTWTGPVLAADRLWVVNSTGHLFAFSAETGAQEDRLYLAEPVFIPPIVADNIMYIVLDNGEVVALK